MRQLNNKLFVSLVSLAGAAHRSVTISARRSPMSFGGSSRESRAAEKALLAFPPSDRAIFDLKLNFAFYFRTSCGCRAPLAEIRPSKFSTRKNKRLKTNLPRHRRASIRVTAVLSLSPSVAFVSSIRLLLSARAT